MEAAGPSEVRAEGREEAPALLEDGGRPPVRHGHGLGRDLIRLIDQPLDPVDAQDAVAQHLGDRSSAHLLDHQSEQHVVGVPVLEPLTRGNAHVGDQLQQFGRLPQPLRMRDQPVVDRRKVVGDAASLAQQMADRGPVRVEVETAGQVIGGRVVEAQLAGFHHLHHLGGGHRLRDAGDRELVVDRNVSNAVSLAHRSAPCPQWGHHRDGDPGATGHVVQDRLELGRLLGRDPVLADVGERFDREAVGLRDRRRLSGRLRRAWRRCWAGTTAARQDGSDDQRSDGGSVHRLTSGASTASSGRRSTVSSAASKYLWSYFSRSPGSSRTIRAIT